MNDEHITVTIRLIRSFEFRNIRNVIIRNINSSMQISDLKILINEGI